MSIAADEAWYAQQDARKKLPRYCPIAAIDKCPRYYVSMQHAAASMALNFEVAEHERVRIESLWANSDVFVSMDCAPGSSVDRREKELRAVDNFCPEVTWRIFGLFCSSLHAFPDEEARRAQHQRLKVEGADATDLRWEWMLVVPRHFSACREFSVLATGHVSARGLSKKDKRSIPPKLRFAVLARDQWRCIYCGQSSETAVLHVDHKVSRADGGSDDIENLVTACEACNLGKGAKSVE